MENTTTPIEQKKLKGIIIAPSSKDAVILQTMKALVYGGPGKMDRP